MTDTSCRVLPYTLERPVIPAVVAQHADDAAAIRQTRSTLLRAPHVNLTTLARADERLAAHLDGLSVAGEHGVKAAGAALESLDAGSLFVAMVMSIEHRDLAGIERLVSLAGVVPCAHRALSSAFGWVSRGPLRGLIAPLLTSASAAARRLGIAACAQQRVDPGPAINQALEQPDVPLRALALKAAGELGRVDLLPDCLVLLNDADPNCRLATALAAVLLRDRGDAMAELRQQALVPEPPLDALAMFLLSANPAEARTLVQQLAAQGSNLRVMIKATAWAGDVQVIPWLLKHMECDSHARLAGEAFSFISGVDLVALDMERPVPANVNGGPNDNPAEADVAMDEDESLPWPDVEKISAWWQANGPRFQPGTRHFVGEPPSVTHCISVLKHGFQCQRSAAAQYLCLLEPGTPLFNVAAPAWRQQRLLAEMKA